MNKNKKFLITGSNGQLAKEFQHTFTEQNVQYTAFTRSQLDITDFALVEQTIKNEKPDVVLNCAAYNLVDVAEDQPEIAHKINVEAVGNLARVCQANGIFFVHYSTDYVFDGQKNAPYTEEDEPNPINVYAQSKYQGEQAVEQVAKDSLTFRVSWVFGEGQQNFFYKVEQWLQQKDRLQIVDDNKSVVTYAKDIVDITLLALEKGLRGLYHLTNSGACSRYESVKYYVMKKGIDKPVDPISSSHFVEKAKRAPYTLLSNQKISKELNITIPHWQDAVDRFIERKNK